ncbi:MAG: hypothetical protein ABI895_04075 [Deltaproteobacteria bacterium]
MPPLRSELRQLLASAIAASSLALAAPVAAAEPVRSAAAVSAAATASGPEVSVGAALGQARRMLLERAKGRYEAGRGTGEGARQQLEGALDALRLAYQLTPAPWLLFNLAQVQSRLGACSEAADLYRRFLASEPGPEAGANAEQALKLLGSCEESKQEPATRDSMLPGLRPPTSASLLAELGRAGPVSPLAAASAEPAPDGNSVRIWPWIFGALSLTSGVAGAGFYAEARAAKRDLDRLRVAGPLVAETQHRGESAQATARVFGGFALGFALAAGASAWLTRPDPEAETLVAAVARLSWLPVRGGAGAAYCGEF